MSEPTQVVIPDFVVHKIGQLTLQLASAEDRIKILESELAEAKAAVPPNGD